MLLESGMGVEEARWGKVWHWARGPTRTTVMPSSALKWARKLEQAVCRYVCVSVCVSVCHGKNIV